MSGVLLGEGGEFDLIRGILAEASPHPELLAVGPGDDAAILAAAGPVLSTDMTVEGVHFRREWLQPWEVGYRAAMAALSDLAAMGARPLAILASIAASRDDAGSGYLASVGRGTRAAAEEVGAALAGGDVTRSPGPLVVDVVVVGQSDAPVLRRGAAPRDEIWVTGRLGGAAGAVRMWEEERGVPVQLRDRFARPAPRVEAMLWLVDTGLVTAGIDLSDGLLQDAGHLSAASGVQMVLEEARVPIHPVVVREFPGETALWLAVAGGEDYELLITARPGLAGHREAFQARFGVELTRVGQVAAGAGAVLMGAGGEVRDVSHRGFDHFPPGEGGDGRNPC